jgi:hypothetical protein
MKKVSFIQFILTVIFVVALLTSNIIANKTIQLPFGIVMTSAVLIFPITYILSDVFSEVYGYKWSRVSCYIAFAMNLLMVAVFALAVSIPAPVFFENTNAFKTVLLNTPRVLLGSSLAFVVGDFVNDKIFKKMKMKYLDSHKRFTIRAITSSFFGEVIDSLIFLPIVFWGILPINQIMTMLIFQVALKTIYEIAIMPLTRFVMIKISKLETKNNLDGV